MTMTFANPHWLWLLLLVPLLAFWEWRRWKGRQAGLRFGNVSPARTAPSTWRTRLGWLPAACRLGALALGICALARPQELNVKRTRYTEGINIMLVLDVSTSMRAQDLQPNRFEAARDVAAAFIRTRETDRVGLVVFAGEAYLQAPLTLDYSFLLEMLSQVEIGRIEDGTAIGTALAMAVERLHHAQQARSEAASNIIILLTDGQNNRGEIDPRTAASIAAALGVRIYTVGIGTRKESPSFVDTPFGPKRATKRLQINEKVLRAVAQATGGRYFRATSSGALRAIYSEISKLEKSKIHTPSYTQRAERYARFLWPAFVLILTSVLLSATSLQRFP